jgi:hypothetical protein
MKLAVLKKWWIIFHTFKKNTVSKNPVKRLFIAGSFRFLFLKKPHDMDMAAVPVGKTHFLPFASSVGPTKKRLAIHNLV